MGRILVADDHDALRRGLARGLTEAGHEVEEASNGNAAIERLHDSYFDVVLSDMKIGAFDYVQKPFEIEEMEVKIEKALEVKRLKHELEYLRDAQADIYEFDK